MVIGRRPKPESELGRIQRQRREYEKAKPELREKRKKASKEYYKQHRRHDLDQKKIKRKEQNEFLYELMGSKCMICGDVYNRHLRRTNLEFHHKKYYRGHDTKAETFRQVLDALDEGGKELVLKKFGLLCHVCHMSITWLARDIRKGLKVLEYIEKEKFFEL